MQQFSCNRNKEKKLDGEGTSVKREGVTVEQPDPEKGQRGEVRSEGDEKGQRGG